MERISFIVILLVGILFPCQVRSEDQPAEKRVIHMLVTAYCPCTKCCGPHAKGITSRGKDAHNANGVAADPKLLPYWTKLNIPGVGIRVVDDTGGAMRRDGREDPPIYHIDVRFKTHKEALDFGRREEVEVEILP